jgi:multidrug efflux system membrane fusion protein
MMDERTRSVLDDLSADPLSPAWDPVRERTGEHARADTRWRFPWRSIIILCVLAVAGTGLYRFVTTSPAQRDPPSFRRQMNAAQPVGAAIATKGTIRIIVNALGTVTPIATTTVKPRVSGQLVEVNFVEGQVVKEGDFLAQIDPRPFELAEQQYEGQRMRDQGLLDQARMNLARYQLLLKQNSIARQQTEDQVFVVKQYEGAVRADQALIDAQRLNLTYARIIAPISGRIGLRLVDIGNYVQSSDTGLAVITQIDPISVIFTVPEDEVTLILTETRAGRTLEAAAYDRANANLLATGKVIAIDNQIDTTTGTIKIRAQFENHDEKLFPKRFVTVRLIVKSLENVVTVPAPAIQRGQPGTYVYVIGKDNIVSVRKVETGPIDAGLIAVTAGLEPGERVVVDGADRLRDGAKVTVPDGKPPEKDTILPPRRANAEAAGGTGEGRERRGAAK